MAAFAKSVANRLRDGKGQVEADIIVQIASEQAAIAKALVDPKFVDVTAALYAQELTLLNSNIPLTEAKREVTSIFKNRVVDCKGFVSALAQPEFIAHARAQAAQPAAEAKPYQLPERKVEEIIRRLCQPNDPDGAEPAVHVAASARGQQVTHQALANLFRPNGQLRAPFVDALTQAAPKMTGEQVQALAGSWLKARHDPAHAVADATKLGAALYDEALRRAEAVQNQRLGITNAVEVAAGAIAKAQASSAAAVNAPSLDLVADAPSTITNAPRVLEGKLQTPDLAIGGI